MKKEPNPASLATAETESDQLRLFLTTVTVQVFNKYHDLENCGHKEVVSLVVPLVKSTMEGLAVPEGFRPGAKYVKHVARAVVKDLKTQFCTCRLKLKDDPAVLSAFVSSLRGHTVQLSESLRLMEKCSRVWKDYLRPALIIAIKIGVIVMLCLAVM